MRLSKAQNIVSRRTAETDAFVRDTRSSHHIEDQVIGRLNNGVAEQAKVRGDAEILAKGVTVSLTGSMAARALQIVAQVLMARVLGAANFGLYAIGWTLVRLLENVTTLGLQWGVIYFGAGYQQSSPSKFKGVLTQSIAFSFLTGLTIGAILYLAAPTLAEHVFRKPNASRVIRAFAPAFPLNAVFLVGAGMTNLSQRMQYYAYSDIASAGFALASLCIFFMLGWGLKGAVVATVGGIAVGTLMSLSFSRGLFPAVFAKGNRSEWLVSELFAYSIPLAVAGLAASLLGTMDRLFVASFCTSAETGIYQAASQLSILFALLFGAFNSIFAPMVADLHARGESQRLAELYRICAKWRAYVCAPVLLIVLFASVELVESLYGSAYVKAARPLLILSVGQLFAVIAGTSQIMLSMTGRQKTVVLIILVALLAEFALNIVLVPRFGLVGAATAAAVSAAVLNVSAAAAVRKNASISLVDMSYAKILGAAAVTCAVLFLLRPPKIGTPELRLFIVAVITLGTFTVSLIALGLDAEDWQVFDMLRARFRLPQPFGTR